LVIRGRSSLTRASPPRCGEDEGSCCCTCCTKRSARWWSSLMERRLLLMAWPLTLPSSARLRCAATSRDSLSGLLLSLSSEGGPSAPLCRV
jgi:hypothetical protein